MVSAVKPNAFSVNTEDLLKLLAGHFGVDPEKHRIGLDFRFAFGEFGPSDDDRSPGLVLGLTRVTLVPLKPVRAPRTKKKAPTETT